MEKSGNKLIDPFFGDNPHKKKSEQSIGSSISFYEEKDPKSRVSDLSTTKQHVNNQTAKTNKTVIQKCKSCN
jgi:hypothetical protein